VSYNHSHFPQFHQLAHCADGTSARSGVRSHETALAEATRRRLREQVVTLLQSCISWGLVTQGLSRVALLHPGLSCQRPFRPPCCFATLTRRASLVQAAALLRNTYTTSFARPGRRVASQRLHDELRSSRPPRCSATLTRRASARPGRRVASQRLHDELPLVQAAALLSQHLHDELRSSRPPRCSATLTRRASLVQAAVLLRNTYTTSRYFVALTRRASLVQPFLRVFVWLVWFVVPLFYLCQSGDWRSRRFAYTTKPLRSCAGRSSAIMFVTFRWLGG